MGDLIEFKNYNPEDPTTWIPADADNLNNNFLFQSKVLGLNNDTFSEVKNYKNGDTTIYQNKIWVFITDKLAGIWDETKVEEVSLLEGTDNFVQIARALFPVFADDSSGYFQLGKLFIEWRSTAVTIPTANVPAYTEITFTKEFAKLPIVVTGLYGSVPGITVTGCSAGNITTTGCRIYATRNNTTLTYVHSIAIGIVE